MFSLFISFDLSFNFIFFFFFFSGVVAQMIWNHMVQLLNQFNGNFPKFIFSSLLSIYLYFFFINFSSVFSYYYANTSQIFFVLFFSLLLFSSILVQKCMSLNNFLLSVVPSGGPLSITFFLFFVELLSFFIRPLTLAIRLFANILAGHVLMMLLWDFITFFFPFFPLLVGLEMVELFVSFIQAYIFFILVYLYFAEC